MPEQLQQLKAIGLRTYENQFSAPDGGMAVAQDVMVDRPDVIETVRQYTGLFVNPGNGIIALTQVDGDLVCAQSGVSSSAPQDAAGVNIQTFGLGTGGVWQTEFTTYYLAGNPATPLLGPQARAADNKLNAFNMNGNTFIACDAGMYKWDKASNLVRRYGAGMPRANFTQGPTFAGGAGDFQLAAFGSVRYRTLYLRRDSQKNLVAGVPSPSFTVFNNTAAAVPIQVLILFPATSLEPGDLLQIYRSETAVGAVGAPNTPTDEVQLVLEYVIQSADLTAAWPNIITFSDKCPDGAKGSYLYTNENTGEGILQANTRPPLAKCALNFKNVAWYANTKTLESLTFSVLDITSWTAGATTLSVTNGVRTYTYTHAGASTNNLIGQVCHQIVQALSGSAGAANTDFQAFQEDTLLWNTAPAVTGPGTITLETLGKGSDSGGPWVVTLANGGVSPNSTSPVLTSAGSNRTLVSDDGPNRLYLSKPGEPEHVPEGNYVEVGNKSDPIVDVQSLRDSLFVFKAKDGVFRITGTTAQDIRIEAFDPTVLITQTNGVGKGGNQLFVPSNKGVVVITESGVLQPPITRPIESDVLKYVANPSVGTAFVGRACESERKYTFIANGTLMYQFNWELGCWTTRTVPNVGLPYYVQALTSGALNVFSLSDRFYLGNNNGSGIQYIIPPADSAPNQFAQAGQFAYVVIDGNNPGLKKRFLDVSLVLTGSTVTELFVTFSTETTTTPETVHVTGLSNPYVTRVVVPRSCQYASQLNLTVQQAAGEYMKVSGVSVTTSAVTTQTAR